MIDAGSDGKGLSS